MVDRSSSKLGWKGNVSSSSSDDLIHGRIQYRLGSSLAHPQIARILDARRTNKVHQLEGAGSSTESHRGNSRCSSQQDHLGEIGQCFSSSLPQQIDRSKSGIVCVESSNIHQESTNQYTLDGTTLTGNRELRGGSIVENSGSRRLDIELDSLSQVGETLGATHHRQDGRSKQQEVTEVQLENARRFQRGSQLSVGELVNGQQLRVPSISIDSSYSLVNRETESSSHSDSASMVESTMDATSSEIDNRLSNLDTSIPLSTGTIQSCGTTQQPQMELRSIQDFWRHASKDWTQSSQEILVAGLKNPRGYNHYLKKYLDFCAEKNQYAVPGEVKTVADFLDTITRSSDRPESIIKQARAAIATVHRDLHLENPTESPLLARFVNALILQRTKRPMKSATPVPIVPILDEMVTWEETSELPIELLRAKALVLLCFVAMQRPSDAAGLRRHHINFIQKEEGTVAVKICMLGFKTDGLARGEEVTIWKCSVERVCPVRSLQFYLDKSGWPGMPADSHVFLSLKKGQLHKAVGAQRVSRILSGIVQKAGLDASVFTGRTFRSGGATAAIEKEIQPDQVMKLGRWKNPGVFFSHYVATRLPQTYSDLVLDIGKINVPVEETMNLEFDDQEEEEEALAP
jgi:integrase